MSLDAEILKGEERIILELRSLYHRYGFAQYKMSKFEEYDLYVRNKDFLTSQDIITFTDTNGKLMALKPDVTLSIVRNTRPRAGVVDKVYYDESVYRISRNSHSFREIQQIGLECIGAVDDYCIGEVLLLAAKSLRAISGESVLNISHLGVIGSLLTPLGLTDEEEQRVLKLLGEKNLHELQLYLADCGAPRERIDALKALINASGTSREVLPVLEELGCDPSSVEQLRTLTELLEKNGEGDIVRLDFSVFSDMRYYNGIVFQGFVRGAPAEVLSGGQYDKLLEKMGKRGSAIGFAACLDQLELLERREQGYDVDCLLLYGEDDSPEAVNAAVSALMAEGCSVMAQKTVPERLRYRRALRLTESGVAEIA